MRHRALRWLPLILSSMLASVASAAVTVRFVEPQRFLDASLDGRNESPEANRVLDEIERHLLALGARCIPQEQRLEIVVHEIDLGGHYEWRQHRLDGNFRLLRDVVRSRLTIETLWYGADGNLLARAVDRLDEAKFLRGEIRAATKDTALPDEKAMITSWFEARFCRDARVSPP